MSEQVVDASVAIKWVMKSEPFRQKVLHLLRQSRLQGIDLIGPPLLEYEIKSILQRQLCQGQAIIFLSCPALYSILLNIKPAPMPRH